MATPLTPAHLTAWWNLHSLALRYTIEYHRVSIMGQVDFYRRVSGDSVGPSIYPSLAEAQLQVNLKYLAMAVADGWLVEEITTTFNELLGDHRGKLLS